MPPLRETQKEARKLGQRRGWRWLARLLLVPALLSATAQGAAAQQPGPPEVQVAVTSSGSQSLTMSFSVPGFNVEDLQLGGQTFPTVRIAGAYLSADPGLPQVPVRGVWLGVPTTEGVTLQVVQIESEPLAGIRLPLSPLTTTDTVGGIDQDGNWIQETLPPEASVRAGQGWYPATAAGLGTVGYLRDQAVVQLLFHPVQVNLSTGEVRLNRYVEAQVSWSSTSPQPAPGRSGDAYEDLLRHTLLNYDSLGRQSSSATPGLAGPILDGSLWESTAASPAVKIGIDHDGVYRITYAQLAGVGMNLQGLDPRTIKVLNQGQQIPILVRGEEDGVFNQSDIVLFYGNAMRGPYTIRNVYWLYAGGEPGLRMAARNGTPVAGTPSPTHFQQTLHAEQDTAYWQTMPGQSGEDRWFWGSRLSPSTSGMPASRDYSVTFNNLSQAAPSVTVRVHLKGYTSLAHRTRIHLNGQLANERSWSGQVSFTQTFTVQPSLLQNGNNLVTVEAVDAGAAVDQLLVNWIEIDYWDRYVAEDNELLFGSPATGRQQFAVSGLSSPDILVLDVADPNTPTQVTNFAVTGAGSSRSVRFDAVVQAASRYLVVAAPRYRTPASFVLDQPTSWRSPANSADYIIITHDSFYSSALTLAQHRHSQGLRTAVVKIGDVYDEFSGGVFTPHAVRDFLRYAYENWAAPAPAFVVLLGDASQDYKDNLHNGTVTYVPSMNIESALFGEVSSDNWFVSVSGDDVLPDLFVGRLVAQSATEAGTMVQNIIRYDQVTPPAAWNTHALLVADDDEVDFRTLAEQLANALPANYTRHRVYAADYPPGNPRTDIINHINAGVVLATYVGHGEHFSWGIWNHSGERILDTPDVVALTNVDKLPFVVVGDCLNGFFAGPRNNPAMAEAFQRRNRTGAIAIWAPSGLGHSRDHAVLLQELYQAIFTRYQRALGGSTTAAKLATYAQSSFSAELVETYILFGDPATRLGIPVPHPFVQTTDPAHGSREIALDQPLRLTFSAPMAPGTVQLLGTDVASLAPVPTWNAQATAVTYAHQNFLPGRTYELSVQGRDASGRLLGPSDTPNPWQFTTTADGTPPQVSLHVPGGDEFPAFTLTPLELVWSEPVRQGSVAYSIDPPNAGTLRWSTDGLRAVFFHSPWQVGQAYRFTVLSAVDLAGNGLPAPVVLSLVVQPSRDLRLPLVLHR